MHICTKKISFLFIPKYIYDYYITMLHSSLLRTDKNCDKYIYSLHILYGNKFLHENYSKQTPNLY